MLGIGPVCRARNNLQKEFDFMNAKFQLIKHEVKKFIFIRDIGHKTGRSVTNDAHYVIEQLYLEYDIADDTRVFYEDSGGEVSELLHNGKKFSGYKAGHDGVVL
jgi:hypothetical protein